MKISESQALVRLAAYCSKGERCTEDVKKKLLAWELEPEAMDRVLIRLKKEKYLDDERFCSSFIRDKMRFNKWGKMKIIFELRRKKIPSSLIDQSFENLLHDEFEDILFRALQVKLKSTKAKNEYERRTKLIRFGLSRGYSMEQVIRCTDKLVKNADEDDFY